MVPSWRKSSRMKLQRRPSPGAPSPLRIVKRQESADPATDDGMSNSQTERSGPDAGADEHLTAMKRRGAGGRLIGPRPQVDFDAFDSIPEPSPSSQSRRHGLGDVSPWNQGVAGAQTLNVKKTRQGRSFVHGREGLGTQTCRNRSMSGQGRPPSRELFTASNNLLAAPSAYWPETGSSSTSAQYSGRQIAGKSCVLCPDITVTAEFTALDSEQRSVWAAIEVSGRLAEILERPYGDVSGIATGSFINRPQGLLYPPPELHWLTSS